MIEQLSFSIANKKLIENLSLSLPIQKKIALVGLNGAGKSTLIKLLVGEYSADKGTIQFPNHNSTDLGFKKHLGYQASAMQAVDNFTSREYLELCCSLKNISKTETAQQINTVVNQWNLSDIINKPMEKLSQGNVQKLALAQAFLGTPHFIILDEPTHSLDPYEQQRFVNNLAGLTAFQLCLFSSHHINEAVEAADLVLMLHRGKKIALVDLHTSNDFWFVSELTKQQLSFSLDTQTSLEQVYCQNKYLYKLTGTTPEITQQQINNFKELDPEIISLGCAKQVLMPLFNLLANERL